MKKIVFCILKINDERNGSGSMSQRYGFGVPDPDPHQNVVDPKHWLKLCLCS